MLADGACLNCLIDWADYVHMATSFRLGPPDGGPERRFITAGSRDPPQARRPSEMEVTLRGPTARKSPTR
jgi:hypothetical protein